MKNILKLSGIGLMMLLATVSCQKNEKADPMPEPVEESTPEQPMKKGEVVQHVYEVTNTGDKPLYINSVQPACGCTAPDYTKDAIAPGEKGQVTLSFDSKNFNGAVTKTAQVFMNAENSPITLSFKANVQ